MAGTDTWSASAYNQTASFVYSSAFTSPVLSLLDAKPGEKIIDFGCGSGEVTLEIEEVVRQDGGMVLGVDSSESMIDQAKKNGLHHAYVADIQAMPALSSLSEELPQSTKFDAVFTNATLHWCKRSPLGVIESAKAVLREGGRFVGEFGGFGNCVGVRSAMHAVLRRRGYDPQQLDPWFFPSVEDYQLLLESSGFKVTHISLTPRLTPLTSTVADWVRLFCRQSFLRDIPDEMAEEIIQEVQDMCTVDCRDARGNWMIVYVRLRFVAFLQ
ncbi:S-adenosyl-L-methionine-dependent methyltransferase [Heliocybe sulcata]|uniref:S-adenosyl-L-methionine-dependent methyltransferase n=1 Tax=Heliocybe sulcata TaxID=5364 RepID=A0A5C3MTB1_9AGAM|nr:S-adenosyl-L-methionine-dependent methyltransferase [Heliocybe sulcata]